MIGIRRETDYAVRTVLHLASLGDESQVQIRDVARSRRLPLSFVRRIVARLNSAGILATSRGVRGGIRLARPAATISLLDVVVAMEDGVSLNRCLEALHSCPLARSCPAQRVWSDATMVLETYLAAVRFDKLARDDRGHVDAHLRQQITSGGGARGRTHEVRPTKRPKVAGGKRTAPSVQ